MRTEPELLNERLDRLALILDEIMPNCANLVRDALELLKEHDTANLYKCPNCGTWVSAENVVRCKDCKYWDESDHDCNIKTGWFACGADWYCADGERMEGR